MMQILIQILLEEPKREILEMMQILLEESKREILEKEELKGWKREKSSELNLFKEWNIKYSKFYAQLTSGKLIVPKIKKK